MKIACLDFEGVLVPEIWLGLAARTGVEELNLTTRDIPAYDDLMRKRLALMRANGIGFRDLLAAAAALEPLPGAAAFLDWLRGCYQVAIVSDTFYELAGPLLEKLGRPTLLCHRLEVDTGTDAIISYVLRQPDPKRAVVRAFQTLHYEVVATGDSFNDVPMLEQADHACFFAPPAKVVDAHPEFPIARDYSELQAMFAARI